MGGMRTVKINQTVVRKFLSSNNGSDVVSNSVCMENSWRRPVL